MGWFSKAPVARERSVEEQMAAEVMAVIDEQSVLAAFGLLADDLPKVQLAEAELGPMAAMVMNAITPELKRARTPEQREEVITWGLQQFTGAIRKQLAGVGEYRLRLYGCAAHRLVHAGAARV